MASEEVGDYIAAGFNAAAVLQSGDGVDDCWLVILSWLAHKAAFDKARRHLVAGNHVLPGRRLSGESAQSTCTDESYDPGVGGVAVNPAGERIAPAC